MTHPSTFKTFADRHPTPISWEMIYHYITDENSSVCRNTILSRDARKRGDPDTARRLKHRCGAYTPAVQCEGGHESSHIRALTRCCISDTDHIPPEEMHTLIARAMADPHTLLCHTTNSALGLRIIYRWETDDDIPLIWDGHTDHQQWLAQVTPYHKAAFTLGNQHYSDLLGHEWDHQTADLNRLSLYCHDPHAYLNPTATPFHITPAPVLSPRSPRVISEPPTPQSSTLNHQPSTINHQSPFSLTEQWISQTTSYTPGTYNRYVMLCVYRLCEMGVPECETTSWAISRFSDYREADLRAIVRSCYKHATFASRPFISHEEFIRRKQFL